MRRRKGRGKMERCLEGRQGGRGREGRGQGKRGRRGGGGETQDAERSRGELSREGMEEKRKRRNRNALSRKTLIRITFESARTWTTSRCCKPNPAFSSAAARIADVRPSPVRAGGATARVAPISSHGRRGCQRWVCARVANSSSPTFCYLRDVPASPRRPGARQRSRTISRPRAAACVTSRNGTRAESVLVLRRGLVFLTCPLLLRR